METYIIKLSEPSAKSPVQPEGRSSQQAYFFGRQHIIPSVTLGLYLNPSMIPDMVA